MKTILVVDDNSEIRDISSEFLKQQGYNVITAECGEDGLHVLNSHKVDLIFTDVIMPGRVRSIDMVRIAKENFCNNVKVIYTSGYPDVNLTLVGESETILKKPYTFDQLLSEIKNKI